MRIVAVGIVTMGIVTMGIVMMVDPGHEPANGHNTTNCSGDEQRVITESSPSMSE